MGFCSNCGKKIEEGCKFCSGCGNAIADGLEIEPTCTNCGKKMKEGEKFCSSCGIIANTNSQKPLVEPIKNNLPGAILLLLSGIGDIIVGTVFLIIGLIEIGYIGLEFSSVIWLFMGSIIIGGAIQHIKVRNNFDKVTETRTGMITGGIIISIAMIYFISTGTLSVFFILIIIPDIIGFIGAQQNFNFVKNNK